MNTSNKARRMEIQKREFVIAGILWKQMLFVCVFSSHFFIFAWFQNTFLILFSLFLSFFWIFLSLIRSSLIFKFRICIWIILLLRHWNVKLPRIQDIHIWASIRFVCTDLQQFFKNAIKTYCAHFCCCSNSGTIDIIVYTKCVLRPYTAMKL